jgi:hypothetical protein
MSGRRKTDTMSTHGRPRTRQLRIVATVTAAAICAVGMAVAPSQARQNDVRELVKSPGPKNAKFAPLVAGATYRASLVNPTPSIEPTAGWSGSQFVTHHQGKVRYEWAVLLSHQPGGEIDIISGPAMTLTPAAAIAAPRKRARYWHFGPDEPPGPLTRWTIAGHHALYFDATSPGPAAWTLLDKDPAEVQADKGQSFRMTALTVRGKTVVILLFAPKEDFVQFLPVAQQLLASLHFPRV